VEVEYDDVVTEVVCWAGMVVVFVDKGGSWNVGGGIHEWFVVG